MSCRISFGKLSSYMDLTQCLCSLQQVGLVAVGVFVKMSKRFDGVQPLPAHIITSEKHIGNASQSLPTYGTTVDSRQAESAGTSSFGSRYLDGLLLWPAVYLSFVRITKNRQTFFGRS